MAHSKPSKKKAKPPEKETATGESRRHKGMVAGICALLVLLCIAIYGQTLSHGFINYDDDRFVVANAQVQSGLSWATVTWAFTNHVEDYLMPLSWLSHALDCQLYGMWGGGHHLTSLIIHALNTVLLFWVLLRLTGARGKSAMVAAFFAVHPLHVETVAWASERKDVLSTLFWCLALLAYTYYAAKPMLRRYLLVAALYGLALLSKPMVVTLPCLMLLLDYWPLRRIRFDSLNHDVLVTGSRLVLEKLPMLALAVAAGVVAFLLQGTTQTVLTVDEKALPLRLCNALFSYAFFLVKSVFPTGLSASYPWPVGGFPLWQMLGSAVLLLAITAAALVMAKKRPYLIVGWLWYLGLMVPTMQLMQHHAFSYARADRYTYCALIGVAVMVVWGVADLAAIWRVPRRVLAAVSGIVIVLLAVCAAVQAGYWRDSETLFRHAIAAGQESGTALNNLGEAALAQRRYDEAKAYLTKAVELVPGSVDTLNNLGLLAKEQKRYDEARSYLAKALELDPGHIAALNNLGLLALDQKRYDEARTNLDKALTLGPDNAETLNNLGLLTLSQKRYDEARDYLTRALNLNPGHIRALNNRGSLAMVEGRYDDARLWLKKALDLKPDYGDSLNNLVVIDLNQGRSEEAKAYLTKALLLDPGSVSVLNNLGGCCMNQGQYEEAQRYFRKILEIDPQCIPALNNLGGALAKLGRMEEANGFLKRAAELDQARSGAMK